MKKIEKLLRPLAEPEEGLENPHEFYFKRAREVAKGSKYKLKVGCIIVPKVGIQVDASNGFADERDGRGVDRKEKDKICLTALQNCLVKALSCNLDIRYSDVYLTEPITAHDAAMLVQIGVQRVVMPMLTNTTNRYFDNMRLGIGILQDAGIKFNVVK